MICAPEKSIFKALISEKLLKKGEDPLGHWAQGWVKLGNLEPQQLTSELLNHPALRVNLLLTGPLQHTKPLQAKSINTKFGKLLCEGFSGSLTLKGASVSVKNDEIISGNLRVQVFNYVHDKSPFGVVSARLDAEFPDLDLGKDSARAIITLVEVGTGAKSELLP